MIQTRWNSQGVAAKTTSSSATPQRRPKSFRQGMVLGTQQQQAQPRALPALGGSVTPARSADVLESRRAGWVQLTAASATPQCRAHTSTLTAGLGAMPSSHGTGLAWHRPACAFFSDCGSAVGCKSGTAMPPRSWEIAAPAVALAIRRETLLEIDTSSTAPGPQSQTKGFRSHAPD